MSPDIGFSTCSLPPDQPVAEMVAFALEHGFRALELELNETNFNPDRVETGLLPRLRQLASSRALRLGIHSPGEANLSDASSDRRQEALARIGESVRLAAELGAETVVVHPGRVPIGSTSDGRKQAWEQNVHAIRELAMLTRGLGTSISVENLCHEKHNVAPDIHAFRLLCQEVGEELIGVTLDTNHAALVDGLEASLGAMDDIVNYIHFSSNKGTRSDHCEPAAGVVDFRPMSGFLSDFGGPVMIELNPVGEGSAAAVLRTREYIEGLVASSGERA